MRRWRRDSGEAITAAVIVVALVIAPLLLNNAAWFNNLMLVAIYVPAVVGLNILRCEAGQYNFGQGALFGLGAYATALTIHNWNIPYFAAAAIGVAASLTGGFVMSLPSLRVQGFYLGFVTLAAAMVFPDLLFGFDSFTHATSGLVTPLPSIGSGLDPRFSPLVWLVLIAGVGSIIVHYLIRKSRFGRDMRLVATSEAAAHTLGVRPARTRMLAFVIAAGLAGVAGALYVPYLSYVSPGAFPIDLSILFYFAVVVGGEGTIVGPILGVALLQVVPNNLLSSLLQYALIVYGVIAFGVMFVLPEGMVPGLKELWQRSVRRSRVDTSQRMTVTQLLPDIQRTVRAEAAGPVAPVSDGPEMVLSIEGVSRSFGGVRALVDVSLDVRKGTIHALVGPNGCGKSTLLNIISGLISADRGTIEVDGRSTLASHGAATRLVGRTFQVPQLVPDLSLWENLSFRMTEAAPEGTVDFAMARHRLELDAVRADSLPHAQRRMLEVLRSLTGGSVLLLLDEPAAGLSVRERTVFAEMLRALVDTLGVSVLLVEHDLALVWQVADRITIMRSGHVVLSGAPDTIRRGAELDELMGFTRATS
jgi:branched-chain amino acid transport system permease protein